MDKRTNEIRTVITFFKTLVRKGIRILNIFTFSLRNRKFFSFNMDVNATVLIKAKHWYVGKYARIDKNVCINCRELVIGEGAVISSNVRIEGIGKVYIGNYSVISENVFILGLKNAILKIGNLSWVGRGSILNASSNLIIGDGTCIGIGSRVFTHGCWFEAAEGYKLNYKDVYIGNNVWLALDVIVQPGTYINDNVLVNSGSVVSGLLESGHIYSGIPATKQFPLNKVKKDVSIPEKMQTIAYYLSSRLIDSGWKGTCVKKINYNRPYIFKKFPRAINIMFISQNISDIPPIPGESIYFLPQVSSSMRSIAKKSNSLLLIDLTNKTSYGSKDLEHLLLTTLRDFIFRFYPYRWNKENQYVL